MTEPIPTPTPPRHPRRPWQPRHVILAAAGAAVALTAAVALAGGGTVSRMSLPQKATAGTWAFCGTMAQAPGATPGLTFDEQYIVTPENLPLSGTRLEADVQTAQAANGNDEVRFLTAVNNVLTDCRYILAHTP